MINKGYKTAKQNNQAYDINKKKEKKCVVWLKKQRKSIRKPVLAAALAGAGNGLDTWVGENGLQVSGSEARRIGLAKVNLKNDPILLLDEPTEGLDVGTETEVLSALEKFAAEKRWCW